MIRMVSPEMAANFTNEFEEMFVYDAYGELSISDNPYPEVLVGDTLIEVYFPRMKERWRVTDSHGLST